MIMNTERLKFTLQRQRLNSGGYTSSGYYYGVGAPLYWACSDSDPHSDMTFRARDREAAKAYVRERYPNATFYR